MVQTDANPMQVSVSVSSHMGNRVGLEGLVSLVSFIPSGSSTLYASSPVALCNCFHQLQEEVSLTAVQGT